MRNQADWSSGESAPWLTMCRYCFDHLATLAGVQAEASSASMKMVAGAADGFIAALT
jgi:hypothetical protein